MTKTRYQHPITVKPEQLKRFQVLVPFGGDKLIIVWAASAGDAAAKAEADGLNVKHVERLPR